MKIGKDGHDVGGIDQRLVGGDDGLGQVGRAGIGIVMDGHDGRRTDWTDGTILLLLLDQLVGIAVEG